MPPGGRGGILPGLAPPGRGMPGRGMPGPAGRAPGGPTGGRATGRSTGWAEEKGLLPTRGERGPPGLGKAGPGRGPAASVGRPGAAGAGGAGGAIGGAGGAGAGAATGGAGGATATAPLSAAAATLAAGFCAALTGAAAGALAPPNDSRSRRATGASTVDDADLTNSPCSLNRARTSLLVTPSSLANSCTRALPATTFSISERRQRGVRPRLGFSYDAWSSGLHGVLMFFAAYFFQCRAGERFEVLDHRGRVR